MHTKCGIFSKCKTLTFCSQLFLIFYFCSIEKKFECIKFNSVCYNLISNNSYLNIIIIILNFDETVRLGILGVDNSLCQGHILPLKVVDDINDIFIFNFCLYMVYIYLLLNIICAT